MSKRDRHLAEKVIALLERLKFAVRDPDFPQAKLDALQPVLKQAHAIFLRDH